MHETTRQWCLANSAPHYSSDLAVVQHSTCGDQYHAAGVLGRSCYRIDAAAVASYVAMGRIMGKRDVIYKTGSK